MVKRAICALLGHVFERPLDLNTGAWNTCARCTMEVWIPPGGVPSKQPSSKVIVPEPITVDERDGKKKG